MSEGTLLVTALLTALMDTTSSEGPQTLLIDDIDQGLHPKAQRDLVGLLRRIQEERKDLQIICTTHSPYVIDEMKAEEVILLHTDDEGIARAKKLSEHPDAERALQVLTTGEFWSAEGEDWVLGGDGATEKPSTSADSPSSASDDA
jgi:predicted ATP-binding protein involved in virulence